MKYFTILVLLLSTTLFVSCSTTMQKTKTVQKEEDSKNKKSAYNHRFFERYNRR